MLMEMLSGKLHRATVTDADLNYIGSITIDKKLLKASKIRIGQKVDIVNINNGERFSTYAIEGKENSGIICLNGAAARKVSVDDKIIIIAYAMYNEKELENYKPAVVLLDDKNNILSKEEKLIGGIFK